MAKGHDGGAAGSSMVFLFLDSIVARGEEYVYANAHYTLHLPSLKWHLANCKFFQKMDIL